VTDFWRVVSFTIRNKIRSKAYAVTLIVMAIAISIVINLPFVFSLIQTDETDTVRHDVRDGGGVAEGLRDIFGRTGRERSGASRL